MVGEDWVVEAKAARRSGRIHDAAALYEQAAEAFRAEGSPERWAHALRHAAELALEAGDPETGLRDARAVLGCYRDLSPAKLELANALRVAAMAEAAAGEKASASQCWKEAGSLYAAVGVPEGVMEAEQHMAALGSA